MKPSDFDKKFDEGKEDIIDQLDLSTVRRPNQIKKGVEIELPTWVLAKLEAQAKKQDLSKEALIQVWITQRAEKE
ncbi:MAG TPA: CopG family transcriptional regulator [Wenzhouxiangella sp.]